MIEPTTGWSPEGDRPPCPDGKHSQIKVMAREVHGSDIRVTLRCAVCGAHRSELRANPKHHSNGSAWHG